MSTPISFQKKAAGFDYTFASFLALAKRRRYFSISIISWVIIVALSGVILVPSVQKILEIRQELETATSDLATKQNLIDSLTALDANDIKRANLILSAALPAEKPVLPVLYSIDRLATNATVSLSNFQVSPGLLGTASGKISTQVASVSLISPLIATLPLKMSVSGGFGNLSTFFQSLDNVVPFIQINSIQFSSEDKTSNSNASSSGTYSADVALSSLYLKSALPKGKVTSVAPLTARENALLERLSNSNEQRLADSANTSVPVLATQSGLIFIDKQ